jgi:hypothetical protein
MRDFVYVASILLLGSVVALGVARPSGADKPAAGAARTAAPPLAPGFRALPDAR